MPKPGDQPRLSPGVKTGIAGQPFSAEMPFQPLKTDDLVARARFNMPVHAFGYNWLGSCKDAGRGLKDFIDNLIKQYDRDPFWCRQVVLVTHSMGGLVARYCATQPGMADKIAGIVHGVMPAVGAAVAYRRCKVGMGDEDFAAGLVIGSNGREVTAVFAQAPGALQLLPSHDYAPGWLKIQPEGQAAKAWPAADPYEEIYRRSDTWWGLVREEWLSPAGGAPISWTSFLKNVDKAEAFHQSISRKYHAFSQVFYGNDAKQKSFETVTWKISKGIAPDSAARPGFEQVLAMKPTQVRQDGSPTAYVGGRTEIAGTEYPVVYETSYWELHCESQDGRGDGTVPASSGRAPRESGGAGVMQQFAMVGFAHEPAFKNDQVRSASLYAITRIAAAAKKP
jgi:pimeloyl-ACP methyl ester carboxylesterase